MYKSSGGMKRDRLGDSNSPPAMSKRSRGQGRYDNDSSDESDNRRHSAPRTSRRPSPPNRREYDYNRNQGPPPQQRPQNHHHSSSQQYQYKVLCISNLHPKASDDVVRETLYGQFKRYGDISVKVVHEPDERLAFVYFRSAEEAREAKHAKGKIAIYDKAVVVEAAYESAPYKQEFDKFSRRSPVYDRREERYDRPVRDYDRPAQPPPPQNYNHHRQDNYRQDYRPNYNRYPPQPPSQPPPPPHRSSIHPHHPHQHPMDNPHHHPHPHHMGPPPNIPGPPGGPRFENKKDKFPNYLQHVSPEEDPLATRTLFAGNLEVNITDEELRRIFGRYGTVEDIDIKRPPPGTGNAYAFVRFVNLDMAARAKSELSGQYIGKFQCKIGYGKVNPTTKIWIGGLGPWTTMQMLEREFDRFGSIKKVDWAKGEIFAYITYETIDAAQAAVKDMRGYPLGGNDKRLRTDFADASAPPIAPTTYPNYGDDFEYRRGGSGSGRRSAAPSDPTQPPPTSDLNLNLNAGPGSTHSGGTDLGTASPTASPTSDTNGHTLSSARTISDISRKSSVGWQGALILKNSSFPTKLHLTDGDLDGVESLMKDEDGKAMLRITQRLRLDQAKLDDVLKRIQTSTSHGVFLSLPLSTNLASPTLEDNNSVQSRPLRNLVSYLKQKEAAGVISLVNSDRTLNNVLYAFPPCPFSWELLRKTSPTLQVDGTAEGVAKEEHLVVVVIRGCVA